jgi:Putative restriction endonuclease
MTLATDQTQRVILSEAANPIALVEQLPPEQTVTQRTTEPLWPLTVAQYHQMIASGILTSDDPVELLSGWLIQKMTKNPPHRIATRLVREALETLIPTDWYVETQEPITLSDSEPEPDVAIIRGNTRDYQDCHPGPENIALIVEVADSTLDRDRTLKQTIYARAGIATYWIVNLVDRQLEVYTKPAPKGFQSKLIFSKGSIDVLLEGQKIGALVIDALFPN